MSSQPTIRTAFTLAVVVLAVAAAAAAPGGAATLPLGFVETVITSSLAGPTAMALAPDGRIFVAEQGGSLRVIKNDALLATPFVGLTVDSAGERGLLGVALDPNFASNNFLYLYYTVPAAGATPAHNRVSRFTASGDVAVALSETVLMDLDNLSAATNHNGGALHFGPDGKLYIGVGENANGANAQTLNNRLGKLLRINSDGSIPANPFDSTATGVNKAIWALGLRNPYTFAFQPGSGRLFINDVGQSSWEEINDGIAGSNYGWPTTEGPTSNPAFRSPLFAYDHTGACAITGGSFYNPTTVQFPQAFVGKYFFSDDCGGWIHVFDPAAVTNVVRNFATGINQPVDLQVDSLGRLHYLGHGGSLARIVAVAFDFHTLPPCRAIDTRAGDAPALAAGDTRTFTLTGRCGIPATAAAISVNVTVASPAQAGSIALYAGDLAQAPNLSTVDFSAGRTVANNAVLQPASDRTGTVKLLSNSAGPVQVVVDVNGYFE